MQRQAELSASGPVRDGGIHAAMRQMEAGRVVCIAAMGGGFELALAHRLAAKPARALSHIKSLVRRAVTANPDLLAAERTLFCDLMMQPDAARLLSEGAAGTRVITDKPQPRGPAGDHRPALSRLDKARHFELENLAKQGGVAHLRQVDIRRGQARFGIGLARGNMAQPRLVRRAILAARQHAGAHLLRLAGQQIARHQHRRRPVTDGRAHRPGQRP